MVGRSDIGRGLLALALVGSLGCSGSGPATPVPSPAASSPVAAAASPSPQVASVVPSPAASPTAPPRVLERSTLRARGQNPWTLEAQRIEYDEARKSARVGVLSWTLMDSDGRTLVQVEGQGARVELEGQKVFFEGPVVARGARGEVLDVRNLVWDGQARRFLGSEGIRLVRAGSVLTGRKMVASPDLRRLEVEGDVQVRLPGQALGKGTLP